METEKRKLGLEASKRALKSEVAGLSRRCAHEIQAREVAERQLRDLASENQRLRRDLAEALSR